MHCKNEWRLLMRAGFIGMGRCGDFMVHGLAGRGHQITLSVRNAERAAWLGNETSDPAGADALCRGLDALTVRLGL